MLAIKNIWLHIATFAVLAMLGLTGCAETASESAVGADPDPWPEPDPDQNTNQNPVVAFDQLRMVTVVIMPGLVQVEQGITLRGESGRETYLELDENGRLIGRAVVEPSEILYFELPASSRGESWNAEVRAVINSDESSADAMTIQCSPDCRFGVSIPASSETTTDLSLFIAPQF